MHGWLRFYTLARTAALSKSHLGETEAAAGVHVDETFRCVTLQESFLSVVLFQEDVKHISLLCVQIG